jgi:hypothetical protein
VSFAMGGMVAASCHKRSDPPMSLTGVGLGA